MHKEELYEMLCEELDKIAKKGELTAGSLDTIDKLTHSIKSLATIMAMEDEGYSNEDGSYAGRSSYARRNQGRSSRAKRGGYRGYSRNYSMDDGKETIIEQLEDIMEDAPDAKTRKAIEKALMQLND